jgi:nucleoside-diphosphate-sugar epimerase
MRVFLTGASGWIGSALVPVLLDAGHQVSGLARSDASAAALEAAGVEAVRGGLDDLDVLRAAAEASEGVVHLAFQHDVAFEQGDFGAAADADRRAVDAFGDVLAGSGRPFVLASGLAGLTASGRSSTERDQPVLDDTPPARRAATALAALALAERDVRSSVVRLSPTCHGDGDNGFVPMIIATARAKGVSGYVGDGANRWPAVHRRDAARLFALALEKAPAGTVLHGAAEEGVAIRDIAEVIGRHLDLPVTSIAPADAPAHFGFLGRFLSTDFPASSTLTRDLVGWNPVEPGLLPDLDEGHYFRA